MGSDKSWNPATADAKERQDQNMIVTDRLLHELEIHQIELEMQNVELRAAQAELEASRERYFDLYDLAPTGYCTIADNGLILEANLTIATILGVTRDMLLKQRFSRFICKECRSSYSQQHKQLLATREPLTCELRMLRKNGTSFWALLSATVTQAGAPACHVALSDISERHSLENQLRQAQKMEAVGTLTGGIAHDFNNILTAIIGFGSLMEMKIAKDDPLHINITQILAAADRATSLVQSMLAFSRKQAIEVKPVILNKILAGMEKMLRRLIREDIELRINPTATVLTILADAGQIEQVLLNLTTNAKDSMPTGGTITITIDQAELDESFNKAHGYGEPGSYAQITFADSGEGMEKCIQERIFEPFFTTKEVGKGTGLGLAVCYGIIKQHHGFIVCYSEPGCGTTFCIYLPLSQSPAGLETTAATVPIVGGMETILVAEDDENVRKLTTSILTKFGYTVIEAEDGVEAVARFIERPDEIQLCLFDLIMPKKNGRDAYEEIRRMHSDLKMLFMSGYQADFSRQGELLIERGNLISKPIMPRELLRRVREVLDR